MERSQVVEGGREAKCVAAVCARCSCLVGVETELDNQETIDRWFDRGHVLSKQPLARVKAMNWCRCGPRCGEGQTQT